MSTLICAVHSISSPLNQVSGSPRSSLCSISSVWTASFPRTPHTMNVVMRILDFFNFRWLFWSHFLLTCPLFSVVLLSNVCLYSVGAGIYFVSNHGRVISAHDYTFIVLALLVGVVIFLFVCGSSWRLICSFFHCLCSLFSMFYGFFTRSSLNLKHTI